MGNTNASIQELASIVPEHLWVNSVDSKGKPVCWIPLARITKSDIWIGVTGTAFWAIGRRSAPVSSVEQGISIAWLTLLESSQRELAEKLEYSAKHLGMTKGIKEVLLSLPFSDAIYMALTGKSPHWAEIAISRLATAEWKGILEPRFIEPLKQIVNSGDLSQQARHTATRLLREFAAQQSD